MHLWNVNEASHPARGVDTFNIHFTDAPTAPPPSTGGATLEYDFAGGGWAQLGSTQSLAAGTGLAGLPVSGIFDISSISSAQYIGLEFITLQGVDLNRGGIAEAAFTTAVIPEPGPASLLTLGALLLVRRRVRQQ
jgi:hypothetical protein